MTPELATRLLRALQTIRASMTDTQIARALESGGAERVFLDALDQVLDLAYQPAREELRRNVVQSFRYTARTLPKPPRATPTLTVSFDVLNPKIITAIRTMETTVLGRLTDDVRDVVRAHVENALRDGAAPARVAREIRSMVGLGSTQLAEVQNFRASLEGKDGRNPFDYARRDKRFDATVQKALGGKGLSAEQVDKMVALYTKRRIALNAETTARTAVLQAQKLGQRLSWADAVNRGIADGDRLKRRWATVLDGKERPEHHAMNGQVVPWDQPYSNGDTHAGEGDPWNCRCLDVYFVAPAA